MWLLTKSSIGLHHCLTVLLALYSLGHAAENKNTFLSWYSIPIFQSYTDSVARKSESQQNV